MEFSWFVLLLTITNVLSSPTISDEAPKNAVNSTVLDVGESDMDKVIREIQKFRDNADTTAQKLMRAVFVNSLDTSCMLNKYKEYNMTDKISSENVSDDAEKHSSKSYSSMLLRFVPTKLIKF